MKEYTEEEFLTWSESIIGKESFYNGLVNELVNYPPFCEVKEALVASENDEIWARAFIHSVSQHGQAKAVAMIEDNAPLAGMFDWENTVEGWQFWDYVNRKIV